MEILKRTYRIGAVLLGVVALGFWAQPAQASGIMKPANNLGLVGYWSFEDASGTTATDFSGNGNTGTLVNMSSSDWVGGKRGKGVDFQTAPSDYDDYVAVSNIINLNASGSIALWFKGEGLSGSNEVLISSQNWDTARDGVLMTARSNVGLYWELDSSSTSQTYTQNATMDSNRWYHAVLAWDGSTVKTYLDGVQIDSRAQTVVPDTTVRAFRFGENAAGSSRPCDCIIDEIRMYNRTLSASDVAALYNSGATKAKMLNNSGLIGYWSFEDGSGTRATDFSGNGKTGIITGSPSWTDGKRGKALLLDPSNGEDYVVASSTVSILSVSLWFKETGGMSGFAGVVSNGTADSDGFQLRRSYDCNDYALKIGGTENCLDSINDDGAWKHVVMVRSGSDTLIYLNGALVHTLSSLVWSSLGDLRVGTNNSMNRYFVGYIDEVRTYSSVLSAADVTSLYNTGFAKVNTSLAGPASNNLVLWHTFDGPYLNTTTSTDRSGQSNNGTLAGGSGAQNKPQPIAGKMGQGINFDGTDDYIDLGTPASLRPTSSVSVAAWIYRTGSLDNFTGIMQSEKSTINDGGYLLTGTASNQIRFYIDATGSGGWSNAQTTSAIDANRWYHVVGTWDGSTVRIYLDGVLQPSTGSAAAIGYATGVNAKIGVYGESPNDKWWPGPIDDVRVYNRALMADEVVQLYNLGR